MIPLGALWARRGSLWASPGPIPDAYDTLPWWARDGSGWAASSVEDMTEANPSDEFLAIANALLTAHDHLGSADRHLSEVARLITESYGFDLEGGSRD